jgi:hypothetical protein
MLSYFASWGSSIHISSSTQAQWLVPNSMHLMFAGTIFFLSLFAIESPRWLIKVGKHERAAQNLSKLRQLPVEHPFVQAEIIDINDELNREREATMGASKLGMIKELLFVRANRYRIMLSVVSLPTRSSRVVTVRLTKNHLDVADSGSMVRRKQHHNIRPTIFCYGGRNWPK